MKLRNTHNPQLQCMEIDCKCSENWTRGGRMVCELLLQISKRVWQSRTLGIKIHDPWPGRDRLQELPKSWFIPGVISEAEPHREREKSHPINQQVSKWQGGCARQVVLRSCRGIKNNQSRDSKTNLWHTGRGKAWGCDFAVSQGDFLLAQSTGVLWGEN